MDNNTEKKHGRYKWNEDYTISLIGEEAMWLQLAEEASELSQAAGPILLQGLRHLFDPMLLRNFRT